MARKLLLADDSITIQKVVELVLAEEDFEIKSVSNGEDALNLMQSFKPDIVLADIEMPKMNGYQLCEKIKKNPDTANIPVILLAGAFEPINEEQAKNVGADDSVIKPFESQELISKINAALTMTSADMFEEVEETLVTEGEEEILEAFPEAEFATEEPAIEAEGVEEDLWSMEEVEAGDTFAELAETEIEEAVGVEEAFEIPESLSAETETVLKEATSKPEAIKEVTVPEISVPSKEELVEVFKKTIDDRIMVFFSEKDIKEALLSSMLPAIKDTVEKVLWEVAPELAEKVMKEILKGSIASLTKEVEKVIWETVPDLANTLITKEIEKIKSEF